MDDDRIRALRAQLQAFHAERDMHKCDAPSLDELCERRAAKIYTVAVQACGGVRATARQSECAPKTVRDRKNNARGLYLKDALKVGKSGLYALAEEIVHFADELQSDMPPSSKGAND
jgi:hypothetical protein